MSPLRVGVVGAGAIAQVAHLPVLSRLEDVSVVGVCDNDVPKARALASRFAVPDVFDDIEDLLRYTRPEAVVICTPNHLHEVHVGAALEAGAHVLCERPLALTTTGIERILAARQRTGRVVMVGMNHRFRSDVQAVREFLRRGEMGKLHAIRAGWYAFRPPGGAEWRRRGPESGGGALFDLGLPLVDLAMWLAGGPEWRQVSASANRSADSGVEESGCALITCREGLSVFVDVSWRHVGDSERLWLEIMGERGSASIAPLRIFREIHGSPANVTPTGAAGRENAFTASYRAEWAHFLAAVRGKVNAPNLAEQIVIQKLMGEIYRAAGEGRREAPTG